MYQMKTDNMLPTVPDRYTSAQELSPFSSLKSCKLKTGKPSEMNDMSKLSLFVSFLSSCVGGQQLCEINIPTDKIGCRMKTAHEFSTRTEGLPLPPRAIRCLRKLLLSFNRNSAIFGLPASNAGLHDSLSVPSFRSTKPKKQSRVSGAFKSVERMHELFPLSGNSLSIYFCGRGVKAKA
jgi:hypothetical protein